MVSLRSWFTCHSEEEVFFLYSSFNELHKWLDFMQEGFGGSFLNSSSVYFYPHILMMQKP